MSSSAQLAVVLFVIMASSKACRARDSHPCSSVCGGHNVSHPFRLKDYQHDCGDKRYELSCEKNQLVLYLESGKFYVQSIDYSNYRIRVRDANVVEFNYSSLPLSSLTNYNFSYYGPYSSPTLYTDIRYKIMVYFSCKHAVNSSKYVDTAPCNEGRNGSAGSWSWYLYANDSSRTLSELGLEEGCCIELIYMTSWLAAINHSCTDIHNMLLYGFELSWLNSFCPKSGYYASLGQNNKPVCDTGSIPWILYILLGIMDYLVMIITAHTALKCVVGTPIVIGFLIYKWRRRHLSMYDNIEDFLQGDNRIVPIRYSYKDIKKMTRGFKVKLGKGGYGSVFRGQLKSDRLVAVKMLDKAKAHGQDFINEVATLGRIHHVNVVHLVGYCVEGSKRALIYEFMQNGSLEKYIHSQQDNHHSLDYAQLYAISLGVARGIDYLHKGCNIQILHFDIKPHNILLDEHFNPKVSDFGLAKLHSTDNSIVSLTAARGTIGYMAPELFYRNVGGISYKADVYSFGMLLMEMAGRRRNLNATVEHSSQLYFPFWVYDQLHEGKEINIVNATEEETKLAKKMMIVGLWCIQTKPSDRPSMNKVVEMLEGEEEDLEMPRKPYLFPQDLPTIDVKDHASSIRPSSDPSGSDSKDSISLLAQQDDRSI